MYDYKYKCQRKVELHQMKISIVDKFACLQQLTNDDNSIISNKQFGYEHLSITKIYFFYSLALPNLSRVDVFFSCSFTVDSVLVQFYHVKRSLRKLSLKICLSFKLNVTSNRKYISKLHKILENCYSIPTHTHTQLTTFITNKLYFRIINTHTTRTFLWFSITFILKLTTT